MYKVYIRAYKKSKTIYTRIQSLYTCIQNLYKKPKRNRKKNQKEVGKEKKGKHTVRPHPLSARHLSNRAVGGWVTSRASLLSIKLMPTKYLKLNMQAYYLLALLKLTCKLPHQPIKHTKLNMQASLIPNSGHVLGRAAPPRGIVQLIELAQKT